MKAFATVRNQGLSVVEVLLTITLVGIVCALAVSNSNQFSDDVRQAKLERDVKTLNSAVKVFIANGGNFDGLTDPQTVVDRMKAERTGSDKTRFVGLTGSTVDKRLAIQEAGSSDEWVAVWSPSGQRFEIVPNDGTGIGSFYLDESLAENEYESIGREASTLAYNENPGWVWAYSDRSADDPEGPTSIDLDDQEDSTPPPVPVRLLPPAFDPVPGAYATADFPLTVTLINVNDPSTSILYAIDGGDFFVYGGPFALVSPATITAYSSGDPTYWIDSSQIAASYSETPPPPPAPPTQLAAPPIQLSSLQFNDSISSIDVDISNPNTAGSSTLYYSLVAQGSSHPSPSAWLPYSGTITAGVTSFPDGFNIVAYAKSSDQNLFLDSPSASAFTTAEFFDIPVVGNVLFVVDASSSMGRSFANSTRFEVTIDELTNAINTLPSNLLFNVAMFDAAIHWTDGTFELHEASDTNKQSLIHQIEQLDHGSGTNYAAAFSLPQMFAPVPDQVIFLTDGRPNSTPYGSILDGLINAGVRIDAIGLDLDNEATDTLEDIVDQGGGILNVIEQP
ncbi:MAG: VWA domain-containing protein [Verrucomicrobiota bacterium]